MVKYYFSSLSLIYDWKTIHANFYENRLAVLPDSKFGSEFTQGCSPISIVTYDWWVLKQSSQILGNT